jgi:hypothetical protein
MAFSASASRPVSCPSAWSSLLTGSLNVLIAQHVPFPAEGVLTMKNYSQIVVCALVMLIVAACAPWIPPKLQGGDSSNPIRTIAVLPFVNNSNDVDGPFKVQKEFTAKIYEKYYDVIEANEVNETLKDQMGLTLGAQLDMAPPQKICELLGVNAILYGSLDDYTEVLTGVYNVRRVRVRAKLMNCKTGLTIWKGGVGAKSQFVQGGKGLEKVPIAGLAVAGVGLVGAAGSALSDANEGEMKPFFGEKIPAPWVRVPDTPMPHMQSSGNLIADVVAHVVVGIATAVAEQASGMKLAKERAFAANYALSGLPKGSADED